MKPVMFEDVKAKLLKNPEVRAEYEKLKAEQMYDVLRKCIVCKDMVLESDLEDGLCPECLQREEEESSIGEDE